MLSDHLILSLLIILALAWPVGALFVRMGLPVMLGQLLTGLILGPAVLNIIHPSEALTFLADLGIFFAMFYAGMEMDPKELVEHIWPSLAVAIGGFVLPFAMGFFVTRAFGGTVFQSLFCRYRTFHNCYCCSGGDPPGDANSQDKNRSRHYGSGNCG